MSRKRWILVAVAGAAIVAVGLFFSLRDEYAYAHIATGYAAKQMCSCVHIAGRPLDACLADFPPEARGNIAVTENGPNVRASVLLGAVSAEAVFEDGYGCRLLN